MGEYGRLGTGNTGSALVPEPLETLVDETVVQVSLSLSLRVKGILLYTVDILCDVQCCIIIIIRQLWCSSIMLYNINSDHIITILISTLFYLLNI